MILDYTRRALRWILKLALWLLVLVALFLLLRAFESRRGPELGAWHRITLVNEVHARDVGDAYTWAQYRAAEDRLFAEMAGKLAPGAKPGRYRYDAGTRLGARAGTHDWNRSYESTPATIRGGVLLLHGMSDGPYSMRHLVARYERAGYVVIVPRLPGHGTVPAGLLGVKWQDWSAVRRGAMARCGARTGPGQNGKRRGIAEKPAQVGIVIGGYKIPAARHPDMIALRVAASILADGESSRLHQRIVRKDQIGVAAGGQLLTLEHPGLFFVFAAHLGADEGPRCEKAMIDEVDRLGKDGPTAKELEKAKNQLGSRLVFSLEDVAGIANQIGMSWILYGDPRRWTSEYDAILGVM